VEEALALYRNYPLTQFALVPHGWKYIAWQRRVAGPGSATVGRQLIARLFRLYNFIGTDVLFHVLLKTALRMGDGAVRTLMRIMPRLQLANVARVDAAEHVLIMQHQLFRHEEMEIFIPEASVAEAASVLRAALETFGGTDSHIPPSIEQKLHEARLYNELITKRGTYVHHYPVLFRRVLPDAALISMSSSANAPYVSMSLFTYYPPERRRSFYDLCSWLARAMSTLYGARLHWGKHFPLGASEMSRVYPALDQFKEICRRTDPNGVFSSDYTDRVLGPGAGVVRTG
jgi:hypothetical protein